MKKILDGALTILLIITCLSMLGWIGYNYRVAAKREASRQQPVDQKIGDKVSLSEYNLAANKHTLVAAIAKGCHFCEQSMPFYKTLAGKLPFIAVMPVLDLPYVASYGVPFDKVFQITPSVIHVSATPTLFILDSKGVVEATWRGLADEARQKEILSVLLKLTQN